MLLSRSRYIKTLLANDVARADHARHRKPYDMALDRARKDCNVVAARHSTEPTSMRAVFSR